MHGKDEHDHPDLGETKISVYLVLIGFGAKERAGISILDVNEAQFVSCPRKIEAPDRFSD